MQGEETAEFLKHATAAPPLRSAKIQRNVGRLAWNDNKDLKDFKVAISHQPIKMIARILDPPVLYYQDRTVPTRDGRWNLRDQPKFCNAKPIQSWAILYFQAPASSSRDCDDALSRLRKNLPSHLRRHGIEIGPPSMVEKADIQRDKGEVINAFGQRVTLANNNIRPTLFVVLLPSEDATMYGDIKRACEIDFGLATQCLNLRKLLSQKSLDQYLSNVAMKINAKLGGQNVMIRDPWLESHRAMIIGADMSRPRRGEVGTQSVLAICGSFDRGCQRYTMTTGLQDEADGIAKHFSPMVKELLTRYVSSQKDGKPPSSILYFRDGISEDQYDSVLEKEYEQLKRKFGVLIACIPLTTLQVCIPRARSPSSSAQNVITRACSPSCPRMVT